MPLHLDIEEHLFNNADDFTISKLFKDAILEYKNNLVPYFESLGGKDFLVKHTKNIDTIIDQMYKTILRKFFGNYLPMRNSIPIAIVALGSYGREQLALYSDIDLMIVYEEVAGFNVEAIIHAFLHMAWDAKLDLGHRVHNINDLIPVSKEDITIKSALMESRFITGSAFTWHATQQKIELIRKINPKAYIEEKLKEAQIRHKKYPRSMRPNIKDGVGGLRDAHLLYWIAFTKYGIHDIKNLSGILFSEEHYKEYRIALEFLYRVRTVFHLVHGKKQDTLILEMIPEIINRLKISDQTSFVSKLLSSMHTIDLFSDIVCNKMARSYFPATNTPIRSHRLEQGFYLINGILYTRLKRHHDISLTRFLELLYHLPQEPISFNSSVLDYILETIKAPLSQSEHKEVYKLFLHPNIADFLELFFDARRLKYIMPPLEKVHYLAQFDGYHQYPVTIHSLACVRALEEIKDEFTQELYTALTQEQKQFLRLIALLHDAGKGRKQDHHEVGVKLFRAYAKELDLGDEKVEMGSFLIKYHTLMSSVTFKEDIYSEDVLFKFMSVVKTKERLDLLLILTYADITAVGPNAYSPYKSKLLHKLYDNAKELIGQTKHLSEAAKRLKKEQSLKKHPDFLAFDKKRQKKILSITSNLFFIKNSTTEIIALSKKAIDIEQYRYFIHNNKHLEIEIFRKVPLNIAYLLSKLSFLSIVSMDVFKLYAEMKYFHIEFDDKVSEDDIFYIKEILENSFDMSRKSQLNEVCIKKEEIDFDCQHSKTFARLSINTLDQKGLLAFILYVLEQYSIEIATAKIHTSKYRVRDLFLIEKSENLCQNSDKIIDELSKKG